MATVKTEILPLFKKSKMRLLEAIEIALLNDDCSTINEEPPCLSVSLSVIAMLWDVPNKNVLKIALEMQKHLKDS